MAAGCFRCVARPTEVRVRAEGESGFAERGETSWDLGRGQAIDENRVGARAGRCLDTARESFAGEESRVGPADEARKDRQTRRPRRCGRGGGLAHRVHRLDEDEIDTGIAECFRVSDVFGAECRVVGHEIGSEAVFERRCRARHEDRMPGPGLARNGHRAASEVARTPGQTGAGQRSFLGTEGIGGEDLRAGASVVGVNRGQGFLVAQECVGGPERQLAGETPPLEFGTEGAVEEERIGAKQARPQIVGTGHLAVILARR